MIAATAPIAMKAVQFISRSKFFGSPFEARYPMTAAAVGANTKNASTTNAASADARMSDCVMQKNSQDRRMTSIESITSVGVINASSLSEALRQTKLDWGASLIPEHFR